MVIEAAVRAAIESPKMSHTCSKELWKEGMSHCPEGDSSLKRTRPKDHVLDKCFRHYTKLFFLRFTVKEM
ncbi:hypothetical protein TNCT_102171 [Trichonephila clavata]|uniref:Uncharacterized protein n=1 Tax=Trichonephila clavata TaxID=2740835 RepID=A0A8X6H4U2_TRICU|nr:hypothetical protein TNCT_102171 [Trichonephila clavata]